MTLDDQIADRTGANRNTLSDLRLGKVEKYVQFLLDKPKAMEITITFKPKWREEYDNQEIIAALRRYFRLNGPLISMEHLLLVTEYGENLNLHFHGIIVAKPKDLSQFKIWLNKRFGRSTISYIRHPESYAKYLLKEQTTSEMLDDIIILHDENIELIL